MKIADLEQKAQQKTVGLAQRLVESEELVAREQAARAEADRVNRLKDELLATVSHDLRGPLQGVLGFARLLRLGLLDKEESDNAIAAIERNGRAMAVLIEDLLDASRIITGKMKLDVRIIGLNGIAEAALDNVRASAMAKGITLLMATDPAVGRISADPNRIQQAIWNLLSNAVKFTPRGGNVSMAIRRGPSNVEIEVTDTGIGITREFLPRVFDRFRQETTATVQGGLGLGLSIVRHLIELHGGTVEAHSDGPGRGSTFRIYLPVQTSVASQEELEEAGRQWVEPLPGLLRGLTILLLDSQADSRQALAFKFQQYGATVHFAESVAQALEFLRRVKPDVLVSDLGRSGEGGDGFIQQVRSLECGANLPAIALTECVTEAVRARCEEAGFQLHVSKSADRHYLVAAVALLVNRSKRRGASEASIGQASTIHQS